MKYRSSTGLMSCAETFKHFSLGLLITTAGAVAGPTQAAPEVAAPHEIKGNVTAKGRLVAPAVAAVSPGVVNSQESTVKRPDPKWRPPTAPKVTIPSPVDPEQAEKLAEQWGVKLISLNLTSAGFMMDFRFRVLDAGKALSLFDHRIKPYVVAESSNIKLPVPMAAKVGAMRPTNRGKNIKADKNYYMIFANPDRHVKSGEKVTVIIGDFKVEHLKVN